MLKDWRGTEIEVGSIVVYPGRSGSALWVTEAEVIEIGERVHPYLSGRQEPTLKVKRLRYCGGPDEGTSTLTQVHRVTVIA